MPSKDPHGSRPGSSRLALAAAAAVLLAALVHAGIPPLTDAQRTALDTAFDGRDHREEAFAALVESLAGATPGIGDEAIRLAPALDALLEDPDAHRGALCRVEGRLVQRSPLDGAFAGVREWFIRGNVGRPVIVFVVGLDDADAAAFPDGADVRADGRFYKRIDALARDGRTRSYPAFVAAHPTRLGAPDRAPVAGWSVVIVLGAIVLALLVIWAVTLRVARRGRKRGYAPRPSPRGVEPERLDEGGPLPDDPAAALGELRQRAGAEEHDDPRAEPR
jgi:hypothetical protein